ncbi:putative periplasmic protein YibQ distant homology with nucleoside diphosphatase and polysaccharide deacetylase [Paramagnetospirillum magnetotacticum MS-1]|uniref:Putative periplasmic protein YibQ distant homology with nucleoside diphosphatase and polysaccharide deacetylase n=2 Tax=Paramagnetospirillum magnetotacticum TaxID=188 RepID=A0A0C2YWM6_PARME|nr:putative periplasmic protein YibQ distant homology with nucleoside diphosphatase and polysaccharide deacetylase [Paramagnetospirillum magnetotacticum MS-1]
MGNKVPLWERPSVLVGLMIAVLVAGVGIGLVLGLWSGKSAKTQMAGAEQAPAPVISETTSPPPPPPPLPSANEEADDGRPLLQPPPPRPDPGSSEALEFGHASDVVSLVPAPAQPPASPEVKLPPAGAAVWLRNALPVPKTGGKPVIAIIIDDLGVDRRRSERMAQLKGPLTLSYMTYAEDVARQSHDARAHGHELMVHVPMQPQSASYDPGAEVLEVGLPPEEIRRRLDWGLSRFDGYVGINNHMGSRFTSDAAGMRVVMAELRRRGLAFIDSVTSEHTVGAETARHYGVPFAARHVFLDNDQGVAHVRAQLAKTEAYARKHGAAIAIGHPHDGTIEALAGWLPGLEARGFALVPVSTIIRMGNGTSSSP